MKKLLYKSIIIISIALSVIIIIVCALTTKIKLNYSEKVYSMELMVPGARGIRTQDRDVIKETISKVNKIRYYKYNISKIYNSSYDVTISLYDKNNKKIESIEFYGDVAVHGKNKYTVLPFTYGKLERLCKEFNGK